MEINFACKNNNKIEAPEGLQAHFNRRLDHKDLV
jgi:hypothetical protein